MASKYPAGGTTFHTFFWTALVLISGGDGQSIPDNRCYLENGASSESFFVSEALPIGSTIGQVRVHGDPRPGGSIALHLREVDSPVAISSGSRNLTLRRPLDKEGVDGPASVFVNLICERLHTLDPGFVIPISIRVTDANDNAPKFINAPYALNISEVTVVGTRVLQGVHAVDADQQGPFSSVRYSVLPGPYSDYFEFENELEGTLVLRKSLDFETLSSFDVGIRAQDHGDPPMSTDTVLTVHVVDADDQNPRFLDDRHSAVLVEPATKGQVLVVKPRDIKAFDQDLGINAAIYYTFNGVGTDYTYFKINRHNGRVTLSRDLLATELQHPATIVIRATQQDNPDRYALATLTVSRNFATGIRFLRNVFNIKVQESLPSGAMLSVLANNRPGEPLRYFVSDKDILNVFTISPRGELALRTQLDYEKRHEYVFKIFATDGITNDSAVVNVTVEDVNEWDPHFRYSHYEFYVSGQPDELIGQIEVGDGDVKDKLTLSLVGTNASMFTLDPSGELRLKERGEYYGKASITAIASDNGKPPRMATVPIIVHFQKGPGSAEISRAESTGPLLLAGLGVVLFILAMVVVVLIVYLCKAKKSSREQLPSLEPEKPLAAQPTLEKVTNPMFGDVLRPPIATAMGGLPTSAPAAARAKPSPKIYPAPQPPMWPQRVKKLSWGDDQTDLEEAEVNLESPQKLSDNTNLTVYF